MTTWISTAEQMPDDDQTVLIALSDGEVWTGFVDGGVWRYVAGNLVNPVTVTHWADFPEVPK